MSKILSTAKSAWMQMFLALTVLLLSAGQMYGQAGAAAISGTATDASGAALVGANVQATNTGTNIAQSTTSDAQGRYKIAPLEVGTYNVQASLAGFQTVVQSGVTLAVGSSVIVDFSLPVGQITQTVNVEAQVSRVQTETSEISTLVSPKQIRELPLNGRNFTQLLTLAPGVTTVPSSVNTANFVVGRMYGAMDNYSVSGSRPTGQMFLLDGVDIRNFWEHSTGSGYGGTNLGIEAIGEFQVLTNTYNAQFAGNGVVLNAVSRSGTNDWHGGAYEFIRNSALDAASLADKNAKITAANLPTPIILSEPPPFKRNQFGGAIGGPIKKDKVFFFANYEGLRQRLSTTISPIYLPMDYVANGQLPCSLLTAGYPGCEDEPPTTLVTVLPYPFNGAPTPEAIANLTRFTNIMKLYSLCRTCSGDPTADSGGYYRGSMRSNLNVNEDYLMGRVDYTLSSKDSVFGRYTFDNANVDDPRDPMEIFPEKDWTRNQFLTITHKRIVSPTMVNSLRFGYTRVKEKSVAQFHLSQAQLDEVGLSEDPLNFVAAAGYPDAADRPDASIGGIGIGLLGGFAWAFPGLGPDPDRPDTLIQSKFSVGDDLVWTHGGHSLKIGGVVQRVQTNNDQVAYAAGGQVIWWTSVCPFGFPCQGSWVQSALEGRPAWGYQVAPGYSDSTRYFREIGLAPYFQDDWKVTPWLTLNLGIRYDYFTNPVAWAPGGQSATALQGSFLPPTGPLGVVPTCAPATDTATLWARSECMLGLWTPVKHVFANNINAQNWAPRFGFAIDPFQDHKTSIRGGFAVLHDPVAARIYESGIVFTPPASSYQMNNGFGFGSATGNPCFPDPFSVVTGYCGFLNAAPGAFAAVDYRAPNGSPYTMQFNLGVQREIAAGTLLSVSYVGSLSRHMWMQRDINPPTCTTFPDCTALPTLPDAHPALGDPDFATATCATVPPALPGTYTCYGSGAQFPAGSPRINTAFGSSITEATTTSSGYNSLQVSLNRQFARNLAGQVNYSWSHCIDNGSFATSLEFWGRLMVQPYNQRYDYGNCMFDVRHNLVANGLYSLPFKGNRLVEGWQVSTIMTLNSGLPLDLTAAGQDPSNIGSQWAARPNYSFAAGCSPNRLVKQWETLITGFRRYQWFDPACYENQANGYFGNVARDSLPGPGMFNLDLSITKNTKVTERLNVQFRAEFFNILDHFNPAAPGTTLGVGGDVATGYSTGQQGTPRQIQFAVKLDF